MRFYYRKKFRRQYKKMPVKIQKKFDEQAALFRNDPSDRRLAIHRPQGDKKLLVSMNVTGDYRALFVWEAKRQVRFHEIGTHSELYG